MKLYMGVTPDDFELPMAVCANPEELGSIFGVSRYVVYTETSKYRNGRCLPSDGVKRGVRFVDVDIDASDNGNELPENKEIEPDVTEEVVADPAWDFDNNGWRFRN